ncbi:MAG: cache domain-containing protein [Paracoccaceae bacterium]
MRRVFNPIDLSYGQKVFLLAAIPLILVVAAITMLTLSQSRSLAEREIKALETQLTEAKKVELRNYVTQAKNGFYFIYGNAAHDDATAKRRVAQILAAMISGKEGFFFVYDYDGNNIVSPRQTHMIDKNWSGLKDSEGTPVVDELIRVAKSGAGYHSYLWPKPSTGQEARMISYVVGFPTWRWAVGTGVFVDDILATVATARADLEARIQRTFLYVIAITAVALLLVFLTGLLLNLRERRLADVKLNDLSQRILDTQEEERGRVARELHDSISQILVGVRYTLELAQKRIATGDTRAGENLDTGISSLSGAIQEVRRISHDLRPRVLDDLGLGPALKSLTSDFSNRTGIVTTCKTVVFRNRLDPDAKIALYRVAQEALTNIERHSDASQVHLSLAGHRKGATLRISDNGRGIAKQRAGRSKSSGLGLRNMQERIDQLDGKFNIHPVNRKNRTGTIVEATVPLTHMLPPEKQPKASP